MEKIRYVASAINHQFPDTSLFHNAIDIGGLSLHNRAQPFPYFGKAVTETCMAHYTSSVLYRAELPASQQQQLFVKI